MDFQNALLLVAAVYAVTEFFKKLNVTSDPRIVQGVSVLIAIGMTFLVRTSVWANEQVVGGVALDKLDVGSVFLVGILVGLGANFVNTAVKAVRNIGENTDEPQ